MAECTQTTNRHQLWTGVYWTNWKPHEGPEKDPISSVSMSWDVLHTSYQNKKKKIKAQTDTYQRPGNPDWRHGINVPARGRAPAMSEHQLWNKSIGNHGLTASGALKKKLVRRRLLVLLHLAAFFLTKDHFWHNGANVHSLQNQGTKLCALETFLEWKSCKTLPISSQILLIVAMKL